MVEHLNVEDLVDQDQRTPDHRMVAIQVITVARKSNLLMA